MSRCRLGLLPEGPTSSRGRTRVGPLFAAYSASIPWPRTRIQCIHRDCMSRRHRPPVHFSRGQQICDPSTSHLPLRPSKWLRGQEYDVPYSLVPLPPHVPDSHALPYSYGNGHGGNVRGSARSGSGCGAFLCSPVVGRGHGYRGPTATAALGDLQSGAKVKRWGGARRRQY
jgi:hypothetical protein